MPRPWPGDARMRRNAAVPARGPSLHRTLARSGIRAGPVLVPRLIATWTIVGCLIAGIVVTTVATTAAAGQTGWDRGLGSADDYERSNPDPYMRRNPDIEDIDVSPQLGIVVGSGTGMLEHGREVSGVEILEVLPGSPARAAGLQGRLRHGALFHAAVTIGMLATAATFPPAMIGVMALNGNGESHATIIAVDGERTRDVTDFEKAINKAEAGEVVYLTVVSGGWRKQIRVALPGRY